MSTVAWVSGAVAVAPLYGLVAGAVERVAKRYAWGHSDDWVSTRSGCKKGCPWHQGDSCECGMPAAIGWFWPLAIPLQVGMLVAHLLSVALWSTFVAVVGRPTLRLYRTALGEDES